MEVSVFIIKVSGFSVPAFASRASARQAGVRKKKQRIQ
jgi:hypothetical protein